MIGEPTCRLSAILAAALSFSGCANSYKSSYVTGAVIKQFTTEAYNVYSDALNLKVSECCSGGRCAEGSEVLFTMDEFDACMGPGFTKGDHDKVKMAAELYYSAAELHTQSMIYVDSDPEDRESAVIGIYRAAMSMLRLMPKGEELCDRLNKLTRRVPNK